MWKSCLNLLIDSKSVGNTISIRQLELEAFHFELESILLLMYISVLLKNFKPINPQVLILF